MLDFLRFAGVVVLKAPVEYWDAAGGAITVLSFLAAQYQELRSRAKKSGGWKTVMTDLWPGARPWFRHVFLPAAGLQVCLIAVYGVPRAAYTLYTAERHRADSEKARADGLAGRPTPSPASDPETAHQLLAKSAELQQEKAARVAAERETAALRAKLDDTAKRRVIRAAFAVQLSRGEDLARRCPRNLEPVRKEYEQWFVSVTRDLDNHLGPDYTAQFSVAPAPPGVGIAGLSYKDGQFCATIGAKVDALSGILGRVQQQY
jgi:hypothetical protein